MATRIPAAARARAAALRREIEQHNRHYYLDDAPRISDAAFDALAQALVAGLFADYEAGVPEWPLEPAYLGNGWFKAQRFPWDAPIAHPITGEAVTLRDEIHALREAARPWAEGLGTAAAAIDGLDRILAAGPEADWQRAVWAEEGEDLEALQRRIIARVRDGVAAGVC